MLNMIVTRMIFHIYQQFLTLMAFFENVDKVFYIAVSHRFCNLRNLHIGIYQKCSGFVHSGMLKKCLKGSARFLFKSGAQILHSRLSIIANRL